MEFRQLEFIKSAVNVSGAPADQLPWLGLAGRSNVGKSSLLNALAGRKKLARVAANPGKTRMLNFYLLPGVAYLVDLPGYGFAAVSKEEKARWGAMMEAFFANAVLLKAALLIVDARHEPSRDDCQMRDYLLATGKPFAVVGNKIDKLKPSQLPAARQVIEGFADEQPCCFFSAEKGTGRDELTAQIGRLLGLGEDNHD